jgi:nicotinamide riboside transporter PnuC
MILTLSIIALILSLIGNILVNYKKKLGFIIWISSNVFWIVVNFMGDVNYPQVIMYLVYAVLNVQGYVNWSRSEKKVKLETIE